MKSKQKEIVMKYVSAYNNFDVKGMTNDLDNNIVFENISDGKVDLKAVGLAAFKKQADSAKQYFKQRQQTIESWEFSDSVITIGIAYKAILAIDLPNGLKKGDTLDIKGQSVFVFKDDKIISITDKS